MESARKGGDGLGHGVRLVILDKGPREGAAEKPREPVSEAAGKPRADEGPLDA